MKELRSYQLTGAKFLYDRPGAILGDEVGLGKTLQALYAVETNDLENIIVISPKNLKPWWQQEITEFEEGYGGEVLPQLLWNDTVAIRIVKDEKIVRTYVLSHFQEFMDGSQIMGIYQQKDWDAVIIDEVHFIKNAETQRARGIKKLKTTYKWGLSGTPVADVPPDVWGLMNWVAPFTFKSKWQFVNRYCMVSGRKYTMYPGGLERMSRRIAPYLLVRNKADVGMELPPINFTDIPLDMLDDQRKFYDEVETQMIIELEQMEELREWDLDASAEQLIITSILARITRLHQVASDPTVFQPASNIKLEWLKDYLEGGGPPAVIMARYRHSCENIKDLIEEVGRKDEFLVGTYSYLSHGHNLQMYSTLIMYDMWYQRLMYEQAIGRVYRSGQENPVMVYRLICNRSIDQDIRDAIEHKQAAVDMIKGYLRKEGVLQI